MVRIIQSASPSFIRLLALTPIRARAALDRLRLGRQQARDDLRISAPCRVRLIRSTVDNTISAHRRGASIDRQHRSAQATSRQASSLSFPISSGLGFATVPAWTGGGPETLVKVGSVVPTIVFHGDRDTTVHPDNGDRILEQSAKATSPATKMLRGRVPDGHAYTRTIVTDQSGRVISEHWNVHGAGHAWSSAAPAPIREGQTRARKCCVSSWRIPCRGNRAGNFERGACFVHMTDPQARRYTLREAICLRPVDRRSNL
jgi:hypothetical protein